MDIAKFVNKKKNNLPPRPKPPTVDQMMHDLKHTPETDIAFWILKRRQESSFAKEKKSSQDKTTEEIPNMNDPEQVYQLIKNYFNTNKKLSELEDRIVTEEFKLYSDTDDMKKLAEDFKKQANEALLR